MNAEYKRHAYARSILYELQRHLNDRFISAETQARAEIICEDVLYADRVVPQEALHEMLTLLRRMEENERLHLADFVTRRKSELDLPTPNEAEHEKKTRKRKGEAAK